jgi:hypothetical protein
VTEQDLAHVLRRWQGGGIAIERQEVQSAVVDSVNVPRPSRYRRITYRVLALLGFRRGDVGGFGGIVPDVQSSGYGGGFG